MGGGGGAKGRLGGEQGKKDTRRGVKDWIRLGYRYKFVSDIWTMSRRCIGRVGKGMARGRERGRERGEEKNTPLAEG